MAMVDQDFKTCKCGCQVFYERETFKLPARAVRPSKMTKHPGRRDLEITYVCTECGETLPDVNQN